MYNQSRYVHIDTEEEKNAKILYTLFFSKERSDFAWIIPNALAGQAYEVQEEVLKLTEQNFRAHPYSPDAFWLHQRVKDYIYPEKTRRRLAADEMLKRGSFIPKVQFTNTRALEAQSRADMLGDNYCERFLEVSIMQSRRRCLDKNFGVYETFDSFEERQIVELQQRGASYKLARFMVNDWDFAKDSEAQRDWERFSALQKNEAAIDKLNFIRESVKEAPYRSDIQELGIFSPKALRDALIALLPNADVLQAVKKKDERSLIHICHEGEGEWIFFSVGNAGEKSEPTTARIGKLALPAGQYFHAVMAIEDLVNVSITKKGFTQRHARGILDIEVEENEAREQKEIKLNKELKKRGWKQVDYDYKENLVSLAIDFKTATLIIRSAGEQDPMDWMSHVKMLTAERRQECPTCSGNGVYFNDNNPAHKCETCRGAGYSTIKK